MEQSQVNNIITREIAARALTNDLLEKRQAEFVISSEAVDSYGTVFKMDGWDLKRYNNNPIVLYAHSSWSNDPDEIIGTGEVFREDDKLIGRVTFEDADINPKAEKVFRKVQAGTLRMASIGAQPQKGHWGNKEVGEDPEVLYFDRQELLEFSIVPIGSNPDALKRNTEVIENFKKESRVPQPLPKYPNGGVVEGVDIRIYEEILRKFLNRKTRDIKEIDCSAEPVEASQPETDKQLLTIREAQLIIHKQKNVQ